MQETLVLLLYNENSYVKGLKKEGRRGRRSRSVVVVPLDLSIYVVDIAGKPFILILPIYLFKILVKRSINRKAANAISSAASPLHQSFYGRLLRNIHHCPEQTRWDKSNINVCYFQFTCSRSKAHPTSPSNRVGHLPTRPALPLSATPPRPAV